MYIFSVELKHWAKSVWRNAKSCVVFFLPRSKGIVIFEKLAYKKVEFAK